MTAPFPERMVYNKIDRHRHVGVVINRECRVMGRSRSLDETEVLNKAVDLSWSRGYSATSMPDPERIMGKSSASSHDAFGDKRFPFRRARAILGTVVFIRVMSRTASGTASLCATADSQIAMLAPAAA